MEIAVPGVKVAAEATEARDVKAKAEDRAVTVQAEIVVAIVAATGASMVLPKSISKN